MTPTDHIRLLEQALKAAHDTLIRALGDKYYGSTLYDIITKALKTKR